MRVMMWLAMMVMLYVVHMDIRHFEDAMVTWRCNQTGFCHGYDDTGN